MLFAEWSFSEQCKHPWIRKQIRGKTQDILKQRYTLFELNLEPFPDVPLCSGPPLHADPDAGLTPRQLMTHFSQLSRAFTSTTGNSTPIPPPIPPPMPPPMPPTTPPTIQVTSSPSTVLASSSIDAKKRQRFGVGCYQFLKNLDPALPCTTLLNEWQSRFPREYHIWEAKAKASALKKKSSDASLSHHFRALLRKIRLPDLLAIPSIPAQSEVTTSLSDDASSDPSSSTQSPQLVFRSALTATKKISHLYHLQTIPNFLTFDQLESNLLSSPSTLPAKPPGQKGLTTTESILFEFITNCSTWSSVNPRHRWIEAEQLWNFLGSIKNSTSSIPVIYKRSGKELYEFFRRFKLD